MKDKRQSCEGCIHHTDRIEDVLMYCTYCKRAYSSKYDQSIHEDLYSVKQKVTKE